MSTSSMTTRNVTRSGSGILLFVTCAMLASWPGGPFNPAPLLAVPMTTDPGGFMNLPWGSSLEGKADLSPLEGGGKVKEYDLTQTPPRLLDVPVGSIRLITVNGRFARAVVRYEGKDTHRALVAALEQQFGPLDRTPGQLAGGLQQALNWRGTETEINLTYDVRQERGLVFIESQTFAQQFTDDQ